MVQIFYEKIGLSLGALKDYNIDVAFLEDAIERQADSLHAKSLPELISMYEIDEQANNVSDF